MASDRRLRPLLVGCLVFAAVVRAGAANTAAQSEPPKSASSSGRATNVKPMVRAEVEQFRKRAEAALSAAGPDKGSWGILVTDAGTGEVLYSRNPDSYFMPASVAKLFATALALAALGPDYRVRSRVKAMGPIDANGVLHGDLILIGAGDANLSNRKFPFDKKEEREGPPEKALAELADAVVAHGVKEITGDVIGDDSMFGYVRFPSGWLADDFLWSYGAAVSAITFNDNVLPLVLHPGDRQDDAARYDGALGEHFYNIEFSVGTGPRGSKEDLAVARYPGSRVIRITGTIPVDAPPRKLSIGIEEPAEYAAYVLLRLLEARGIQMDRSRFIARHAEDPGDGSGDGAPVSETVVAEHVSVPLSDDVRLTNKNSENLHAELELLLAAHEKTGARNYEDALKFADAFFKTAGIADGDVVLSDASGLSRKDLVTPRAVVQLLHYASTQPWGELYRSSLPVAGEDGTLSERMKNTAAAGRIFAKTGTIGHGNTLAGYATTVRGGQLLFSILGNNNNMHAQDANKVIDAICVAMVEELGPGAQTRTRK